MLTDPLDLDELETGEELLFARPGLQHGVRLPPELAMIGVLLAAGERDGVPVGSVELPTVGAGIVTEPEIGRTIEAVWRIESARLSGRPAVGGCVRVQP